MLKGIKGRTFLELKLEEDGGKGEVDRTGGIAVSDTECLNLFGWGSVQSVPELLGWVGSLTGMVTLLAAMDTILFSS